MGFFLETLFGGLMSGMLYALIGLGFVLIFKASGVFNFAQGAMVLVAALSMARFSEWIPQWLGFENMLLANVLAFIVSALVMFVLAVAVERFVLRHLVNQEATTLLMATLGISYFLDGLGQIAFGSSVYLDQRRHAQGSGHHPRNHVRGRPDQPGRPDRRRGGGPAGGRAGAVLPVHLDRPRPAHGGRRSTRRPSPSASRSTASGSLSGAWRAWSRWWPASSGVRSSACSSPCRPPALRRCRW